MRVDEARHTIELTRTNLKGLLAKLDGNPPDSLCLLGNSGWLVLAVEDDAHYTDRLRGLMHPDTEAAL